MTGKRGPMLGNEYADALDDIFRDTPKAVLAAVVVSFALMNHGDNDRTWERIQAIVVTEWAILHNAGVVPQAVPSRVAFWALADEDREALQELGVKLHTKKTAPGVGSTTEAAP